MPAGFGVGNAVVGIANLTPNQRLHVMGSDRYSIRGAQVHDDVAGRFATVDDIVEDITT